MSAVDFPPPPAIQDPLKPAKPPVVRGARACSVCRAAKMKCVGGEEGVRPCQRCKRSGADCIFEKHRRGRKPGSKLSEASRVLRHLEKGLSDAKLKSQACSSSTPQSSLSDPYDRFPNNELPPLNLPPDYESTPSQLPRPQHSTPMDVDPHPDSPDRSSGGELYPAQLIRKETERTSFFKTILNPEPSDAGSPSSQTASQLPPLRVRSPSVPPPNPPAPEKLTPDLSDPISAGVIDEAQATLLFDLFFLRLNPLINLFDPALHTVSHVRHRCPFLFTTLIMICCKFFKPNLYQRVHRLAEDYSVRAFAEGWRSVEVVQAFTCLTYWREPDDTRTWGHIGYAARMAVELGLNRYVGKRPADETEVQLRERRNRERTYLVLFIQDRFLSVQTGRQWMLPEDDLVRHSTNWHAEGAPPARAEDIIVAAFVQVQRIASESTDAFQSSKSTLAGSSQDEVNHDVHLRMCNGKLSQWTDTWQHEMRRAGGEKFHFSLLNIFRLHIRLFLNSFGVQGSMSPGSHIAPSPSALSACYTSALEILQIVAKEFAALSMLRYSQDSITVMTAYAAVFLLKLLRNPKTIAELHETATEEIHSNITAVSDAYFDVSKLSSAMGAATHHARFLRSLVENDMVRARQAEQHQRQSESSQDVYQRVIPASAPTDHQSVSYASRRGSLPSSSYSYSTTREPGHHPRTTSPLRRGASAELHAFSSPSPGHQDSRCPPSSESDQHYWKKMFRDIGFKEGSEPAYPSNSTSSPYGNNLGATNTPTSYRSSLFGHEERPKHSRNVHGYTDRSYEQPPYVPGMNTYPPPPPR